MSTTARRRACVVAWLGGLIGLALPLDAAAERVIFRSGRAMSVRAHRMEGTRLVLELRAGGEIVCDPALIAEIRPDEVPEAAVRAWTPPRPDPIIGAGPYAEIIDGVAAREGVDPRLVRAVIQVESAYRPAATSPKGAMGLMQLMPATAEQYAVGDPYDPRANIEGGTRHLKSLLERFDLALALAAYNAGEGAVRRFGGIPPFPETRDYVARVHRILGLPHRE